MMTINYTQVPATEAEDMNREHTKWHDGKCVMMNEGHGKATIYLDHRNDEVVVLHPNGEEGGEEVQETQTLVTAFAVRLDTPVTRDKAINAAEMSAYGLRTAMDVASFNSALARKSRANAEDTEVKEHDEFINNVKRWLDEIGLVSR